MGSEEDEGSRTKKQDSLDADLVIVDEFSMVDMWLAGKFFSALKKGAKTVLVSAGPVLPGGCPAGCFGHCVGNCFQQW